MPSKSKKQARLMAAVAHNPQFAKKVGIPQSVGREFYDTRPGFDEGGRVLPSSTEDDESLVDTYVKRPLSGLAAMWGGADPETGEYINPVLHNLKRAWNLEERRRQGLPDEPRANLGIVDETLSLPSLVEIAGVESPEFASRASDRADNTRKAARDSFGLDAPHGFAENLAESAGVMAGQLPVPASIANKLKLLKLRSAGKSKSGRIASSIPEWFSPTVVPSVENYTKGTLFGGILGGSLDHLQDYLSESEAEENQRQWIAEAMEEVLAEEQKDNEDDDEAALAELGYAEGGRVGGARKAIKSLREVLHRTDPGDVSTRKTEIDRALLALRGVQGPSKIEREHLNTSATGIADAAADTEPVRRRQRFGDYERDLLRLLESTAPKFTEISTVAKVPLPAAPPPSPIKPAEEAGRGLWDPEEYNKKILGKTGLAEGGQVAPLSQSQYEHYGEGPEHQFFGERRLPELKDWNPTRQGVANTLSSSGGGSSTFNNLAGLATLGLMGYDVYQDHFANRDIPQVPTYPADTSDTNTWIQNDFDNMQMPTAEFDPTVWERAQQGAGGAFDMYIGSQQGGIGGTGSMLSGAGDVYGALGGSGPLGGIAGDVGGILQGLGDGTVEGYLQAGGDAAQLAQSLGYSGPLLESAADYIPVIGQLLSAYQGVQQGTPGGYASAAGALSSAYGAATGASLGGASTAMPLAALGFAAAEGANYALDHDDRRNALYASRMGFKPISTPQVGRKAGTQLFVMPNGKVIHFKDMEWLSRLSKETGKGNTEADARHAKAVEDLMSDSWHSERIKPGSVEAKWLEQQGLKY